MKERNKTLKVKAKGKGDVELLAGEPAVMRFLLNRLRQPVGQNGDTAYSYDLGHIKDTDMADACYSFIANMRHQKIFSADSRLRDYSVVIITAEDMETLRSIDDQVCKIRHYPGTLSIAGRR